MKKNIVILFLQILFVCSVSGVFGQESFVISGKVTDAYGEELPGVTIQVKGTANGVVTGIDGSYSLSVEQGQILVFSYVGFKNQEVLIGSQTSINIELESDIEELEEIVVVGYGTQRKSDITGSTGLLTSKDVELQPVQRVENMLQGKVAGVVVSQNSGAPGATPRVNIRGFRGSPTYVIDGLIDADINAISPDDIESISVLKDASATAIYGARGANGVILITTKQAKQNEKLKVTANYTHTISQLNNRLDLLDPVSYMQTVNDKSEEAGGLPLFSRAELLEAEAAPGFGTDWQDFIFRTSNSDNLDVSFSKGWKGIGFRFSVGARNDVGIIENSDYQRYTTRLSANYSITPKTKIVLTAGYAQERTHNVGNRADGASRIVQSATVFSPNLPVVDPDTGLYTRPQGYGPTVLQNPAYLIFGVDGNGKRNIYNFQMNVSHELTDAFTLRASGAVQLNDNEGSTLRLPDPNQANSITTNPSNTGEGFRRQWNLQVDYEKSLNQIHNFKVSGVAEILDRQSESFRFVNNYNEDGTPGTIEPDPNNPFDFSTLGQVSYLTRVNYDYKGKLLFTGSYRADASSRLPENNKWDFFPSAALAYRIGDEAFMSNVTWINELKLRAGYGEVGNVNTLSFAQIQNNVSPDGSGYAFEGTDVQDVVKFEDGNGRANPNLVWESARTYNFGLDISVFNGSLELVTEYYIKYNEDAIFGQRVPRFLGGGSFQDNQGQFRNEGIELTLIHQWNTGSDWSVRNSFNFTSLLSSKAIKIPTDTLFVGSQERGFDQNSHILVEGQEVGRLWGYQYLGTKTSGDQIDGEPNNLAIGDAIYLDRNGDGLISLDDMGVLGNGNPDFTWGINTHIDYKNFSLNLFIQGVHGVDAFNVPKHALLGGGGGVINGTSTDVLNSASYGGELPSLTTNIRAQSSLFVEDASFIRLRNITFGYSLPDAITDKMKLTGLRVAIGAQNLVTLTDYSGYDPETRSGGFTNPGVDRGSFPIPRTFTFNLTVNY